MEKQDTDLNGNKIPDKNLSKQPMRSKMLKKFLTSIRYFTTSKRRAYATNRRGG